MTAVSTGHHIQDVPLTGRSSTNRHGAQALHSSQDGSCRSCAPVRRAAGAAPPARNGRAGVCLWEQSGEATDGGAGVHTPPCSAHQALHPGAGTGPRGRMQCTSHTWEATHGGGNYTHSRGPGSARQRAQQLRRRARRRKAGLTFCNASF